MISLLKHRIHGADRALGANKVEKQSQRLDAAAAALTLSASRSRRNAVPKVAFADE
jgi:hypothetical protein